MTKEERILANMLKQMERDIEYYDVRRKVKISKMRYNLKKSGARVSIPKFGITTTRQLKAEKRKAEKLIFNNKKLSTTAKIQGLSSEFDKLKKMMEYDMKKLEGMTKASKNAPKEAEAIEQMVNSQIVEAMSGSKTMQDKAERMYAATIVKMNEDPEKKLLYLTRWKEILGSSRLSSLLNEYFYGSDPWQTYRVGDDLHGTPAYNATADHVWAWDQILQAAFEPDERYGLNDPEDAIIAFMDD